MHIVFFFLQNASCIRKLPSHLRGGGGSAHPPPRSTPGYTCTFLVASCLAVSVTVDWPGNLRPIGVDFVSGKLELSSLYSSFLVPGALVTTGLAGVGFGCANKPCPAPTWEGTEEIVFG